VANAHVRRFWLEEYAIYTARFSVQAISPPSIQHNVCAFRADAVLQRIPSQPKSSFNLRSVMDEGKILLVNPAKGRLGEDAAALLGSLLVAQIGLVGLRAVDPAFEIEVADVSAASSDVAKGAKQQGSGQQSSPHDRPSGG
jgi:hypothetical protein